MRSHHLLSVIFCINAFIQIQGLAFAQSVQDSTATDEARQNRIQSDFNMMSELEDACANRKMTPEQYKASCTGIVNALHQDQIISSEELEKLNLIVQNSTIKCSVFQNYYQQTDAAKAEFLKGQTNAETLKMKHDTELKVLLDANYITPEIYAQAQAELDAEIAQYQQQTNETPQTSQNTETPQEVNNANLQQQYKERYQKLVDDYIKGTIDDNAYRNGCYALIDEMSGSGLISKEEEAQHKSDIETQITLKHHWLNDELINIKNRTESGRMPIRRYQSESLALIDKAERESHFPSQIAQQYRQEIDENVLDYYNNEYDEINHRPDSFIIKIGANAGAAYYSYYHINNDIYNDDSGQYWKGYAGGHIELGYLWHFYIISIGVFARQDLNYIFKNDGKSFLGMTNGIFRIAGVFYDSTLMLSFDMGMGGAYNSKDVTFTVPFALGIDYYVSDRVGIGLGVNGTYISNLNDLTCVIQPDLHIIIDI